MPTPRTHTIDAYEHLEKLLTQRFDFADKAVGVALKSIDERLAGMNEFRETLKDQNATFATRAEEEAKATLVNEKLAALEKVQNIAQGKSLQTTFFIGIFFTILQIALRFLP